jgi:coenzyme Q-binding protein COQ10
MPTHAEKRVMPYAARQMYDLVADVARYPEFLPWMAATRIRSVTPRGEGKEELTCDMVISFKVFRERFGSRALLDPAHTRIDMDYLDGPFKHLKSHWQFRDLESGRCEVEFFVDFEFRNQVLSRVIGVVFNEAMQRIVRAFENRARALYGPGTGQS